MEQSYTYQESKRRDACCVADGIEKGAEDSHQLLPFLSLSFHPGEIQYSNLLGF